MVQVSRRALVKYGIGGGVGLLFVPSWSAGRAEGLSLPMGIPGGGLSPGEVDKFALPLVKPPAMPPSRVSWSTDRYTIAVRQFTQRILPAPHPETAVWGYGSVDRPGTLAQGGTFNYPSLTIESTWHRRVYVDWRNELLDARGNYRPHLLPIDPTLHWANPPGGWNGRDTRPTFTTTPRRYDGPVPIVTHVHGGHTREHSDGYPEAWYLPAANNIPPGYARTGTFYDYYARKYARAWLPGAATFDYLNDQRAATLWYHDHTLGMTRANVYAGLAGFYLIRGGPGDVVTDSHNGRAAVLPGPAPAVGDNPFGGHGELPIVIQDRSFSADGSLFFPDTREFFDGYPGPYMPDTPVPPVWNPEFFANVMVVNGRAWPYLEVKPRRYRLRLLNGSNSRFLILQFEHAGVDVWQIGSDGGFLPAPVRLNDHPYPGSTGGGATVLLALAERADLIVDFSAAAGTSFRLLNLGPDAPFAGGAIGADFAPSDPESTGQVMEFRVSAGAVADPTTPPQFLRLPVPTSVGAVRVTRDLSLNEESYADDAQGFDGPVAAVLGTWDSGTGRTTPLGWSQPITENPAVGEVEEWAIHNLTADAHPIHVHQVQFEIVGRQAIEGGPSVAGSNDPLPWEAGSKDTVIAYPGEVTRLKAKFDLPGFFPWHCHILDHEDNEMMRPFHVGPIPWNAPAGG